MRSSHLQLIALLAIGWVFAEAGADSEPPQPYTCDRIDQVPAAERCTFVTEKCESEGGLPYTQWYYCNAAPHGPAACFFFTVLLAALLPLFFTLLGDTAEVYFSPIMTHVSQSIPKMRPRFAGVTFVAMGNGATDLSANITAIRNGDVLLSAGALTGAAMFVQCVVASEVMRASRGPVSCRGATLRDLGIYVASVLLVLVYFSSGKITYWFIVGAVLLYLTYAVWVFLGDEWHERGRPEARTVWRSFKSSVSGRFNGLWGRAPEESLPWALMELGPGRDDRGLTAPLVSGPEDTDHGGGGAGGGGGITSRPSSPGPNAQRRGQSSHPPGHPARHSHLVSAKAYQEMVWADLGSEDRGGTGGGGGGGGEADSPTGRQGGGRRRRAGRVASRVTGPRRSRHSVEMGRAEGGHGATAGGGGGGSGDPGSGGGGGGSVSQLLTLSSLNGSVLPAPAPLDAAPARRDPTAPPGPAGAAAAAAAGAAAAVPGPYQSGRAPAAAGDATWGSGVDGATAGGAGGESDVSSLNGKYDSEEEAETEADEEAGLLGGGGGGRRGGSWRDGEEDDDEGEAGSSGGRQRGLWGRLRYELTVGTSAEWEELPRNSLRRRWRDVTFPLLLPVYAALRFTIPFVDPATYSRRWLVATCVGAPLLAGLFIAPGSWLAVVLALAAGGALAAAVAYFTSGEDELPDWDLLGTGFAFGPAFFAVLGFFMGIIWIDILASQVVGVIALLASLLRLPASVMGLTLLAWGNSLGDLFGNPAMARRGKPSMALTACFAGPLFNMLTSMALGFGSYFARQHVGSIRVELRPEVAIGCVFLVLYNLAVAVAGLMNHGSLPERFYLFARGWYLAYVAVACGVGLWKGEA